MLNIQGFFSKVFGPLVSGLKAILHWLLPNWLIRPIEYLSSLIFGEIHSSNIKQNYSHSSHSECNSHLQTEETALTVIFVFIAVIYGSILGLGYVFKIIYGISVFLNLPYHSQLRRLVTNAVLDDRPLEPTQVESSTSLWQETLYCLSPDWTHHQLGILMLVLSLFLIIMFKLTRCVFRLSRKFLRLFVTVCIPKSVKHFSIMPTKRTKHKIPPIKPSSANSSSLPNPGNPPVRSRTTSFVKLATLSFLSPPNIKNDMSISKDSVSPTVLSLTSSITGAHRVQRSNTFTAPSSSDATRLPQHNVETRKTNGHFTIKYHPL
ncbi:uncharacterized protein LOC126320476 [Schistocerca gregaria]|uniref:uncharacterized protein LOC126320476 n=1 Tax=Schistocerca gregaria TaxID=7010 RepID=UPI00211E56D7|nr:uncharacterized protein LOC126320476 [Schistocerca gregaria]